MKTTKTKYYRSPTSWYTYLKVDPDKVYYYDRESGQWVYICYTADLYLKSGTIEVTTEQVFIDIL